MAKKGGDAGSKLYDYYGTIAGVVCAGPVDELVAILVALLMLKSAIFILRTDESDYHAQSLH